MISFVLTLLASYLIYYIFIVRKYDEHGNRIVKKNSKIEHDEARYPSEVEFFIYKYKVDIKKVNFRAMLKLIGLVCSIDIALIVLILTLLPITNMYAQLGIGALLVIPVILISFSILGKVFKKRGLTRNV